MLDDKMISLKKELTEYTGLVQAMIEKSVQGLLGKTDLCCWK